jgi:hypothetical protein
MVCILVNTKTLHILTFLEITEMSNNLFRVNTSDLISTMKGEIQIYFYKVHLLPVK